MVLVPEIFVVHFRPRLVNGVVGDILPCVRKNLGTLSQFPPRFAAFFSERKIKIILK